MIETQVQEIHKQKPSLTFTVPSWILAIAKVVDYGAKAVQGAGETVGEAVKESGDKVRKNPFKNFKASDFKLAFDKVKNFLTARKKISIVIAAVLVVAVLVSLRASSQGKGFVQGAAEQTSSDRKIVDINKSFEIPIKTKEGEETGEKLNVKILTMEIAKEILIQGKPAKAKDGKAFLLITMEIENPTKRQLSVKPIDMVRMINADGKGVAAEVHNNEVSSEPVSTKKTRIGYVINEGDTHFKFLIGEVRGVQEPIEVSF